jgi:hypothetical protein
MSPDALLAVGSLISRVFILCVITVIINGTCFLFVFDFCHPSLISLSLSPCIRCLAENETECPNCAREYGVIREIRTNNARLAHQHDVFLSEVHEGGFEAVAAGFGRGLLNMSGPEDR